MSYTPAVLEHKLRSVAEQTKHFAMLLMDVQGHIEWLNPAAESILNLPHQEAIGRHFSIIFMPEDIERGIPQHELEVSKVKGSAENDRRMARADNSNFWAAGITMRLLDDNGNISGFAKILRNRTEVDAQLKILRNKLESAESLNNKKDTVLATVSHELRNPLAPLKFAIENIKALAPKDSAISDLYVTAERQIETLQYLIGDLMNLSQVRVGNLELRKEVLEIHEIIRRSVESAKPLVDEKQHQLEVLLPHSQILIEADPIRLEQVFVNLIKNSVKYTPEGGNIWIKGTVVDDEAIISVADDGVGIPRDMLPRIFDLFTQVKSAEDRPDDGLGIGLALVKDILTLHGGSIQVYSEGIGNGSEFFVRIPLSKK